MISTVMTIGRNSDNGRNYIIYINTSHKSYPNETYAGISKNIKTIIAPTINFHNSIGAVLGKKTGSFYINYILVFDCF